MPNINVDAPVEFGRPLDLSDSVFANNYTRMVSMPNGHKPVVADFEQFECVNVQEEELNDWVELRQESPAAKANRLKEERSFLQKFASGEFLAHHLPYKNLTAKEKIQVLEVDGSHRDYTVQKLQATHNGLVGYILVPTTAATDATLDLKVIFQGTASMGGVDRDIFEGPGAGAESFESNKMSILLQINDVAAQYQKPITVSVAGHSLGSSDAQNCMGALMDAVAQNHGFQATAESAVSASTRTGLGNIQELKLFGCNSPGIAEATNDRAKAVAKFFHDKKIPVQLECNYLRIHRDGVQQTGETTLLNGVSAAHAKVEVMKAVSLEKYSYTGLAKRAALIAGTTALGVIAAPVLPVGIAAGLALGATTTGLINTADAHTQHVFNPNLRAHFAYERYSNQDSTLTHKVEVKKSTALNTAHKGLLSVVNGLKGLQSSVTNAFRPSPKPVLFSSDAQAVVSATSVVQKPAVVEPKVQQRRWWQFA